MNIISNDQVIIFDTTLRDGEQSPGATLNVEEKLAIAHQLALLGVDVIEAGFAVAVSIVSYKHRQIAVPSRFHRSLSVRQNSTCDGNHNLSKFATKTSATAFAKMLIAAFLKFWSQ